MAIYNTNISGGLNVKDCTADANKILEGYTAGVGKEIVVGSMPDNGDASTAIMNGILKAGFTDGGIIENLIAGNVADGVNIGGIIGTYPEKLYDTGTVRSSGTTTLTFNHNLGRIPNAVAVVGDGTIVFTIAIKVGDRIMFGQTSSGDGHIRARTSDGDGGYTITFTATKTSVTIGHCSGYNDSVKYSGTSYTYFVL